jgi:hypothetical protein
MVKTICLLKVVGMWMDEKAVFWIADSNQKQNVQGIL